VHETDRDSGGERGRRVTGGEGRRRGNDPDRVERRIRERWARPVEGLLEDRDQERGSADRQQSGRRGVRTPPLADRVTARADRRDQRPLHPPGRREQEDHRERLPPKRLCGRRRRTIETSQGFENRTQGIQGSRLVPFCARVSLDVDENAAVSA
jgi:hypothetical protein